MLTYKKYIAKSILLPFLTITFILTSFVWVIQILRLINLIDKGLKLSHFMQLVILIIPSLLFMILPLVTVISVIYEYNKLQDEKQLIILKCSGLSNYEIAKPALLIATIATLFTYYISAYLMPVSYNRLKQELSYIKENYVSEIVDARTFNQVSRYITIYADKKTYNGKLEEIILFDNRDPVSQTIFFADFGEIIVIDKSTIFILKHGFRQSYDKDKHMTKLYFDELSIEIQNSSNSLDRDRTSLELFIHEMMWPDNSLSFEKQSQFIIDAHQRIIWPLFNFVFTFLALSTFLRYPYNRKNHIKQNICTFMPVFVLAYIHFSLQKMAYEKPYYILFAYINIFLSIVSSIWQSTRTSIS